MLVMSSLIRTAAARPGTALPARHPRSSHRDGFVAGLIVSGAFVGLGTALIGAVTGTGADSILLVLGIPTLLAGTITGWLFGTLGGRLTTWPDRAAVSIGMALLATAIGDLGVGFFGLLGNSPGQSPIEHIANAFLGALVLWPVGLLLFGLVAVPVTFAAAMLWCWVIAQLVALRRA
jgi:hypothetical protein